MSQPSVAFAAPTDVPAWKRWLLYSAGARIAIFIALFVALSFVMGGALHLLGWGKASPPLQQAVAQFVARALIPLFAYLILVKWLERRRITELAPVTLIPQGLLGIAFGLVLFSTVVGVLYLLGSYHVTGSNPNAPWLPALLVVGLGAGIGEEIMFRGVLFRMVEEGLGTWVALLISALFFGAVHLGNPGATLWSSAAIAIEAGLLFGMLYHVTRSLPLCMGLHAAWNFAQGTIYGIPVSGTDAEGWLVSTRSGPDWLSGGVFGAEASVIALALCSLCTVGLIVIALRRGTIVPFRRQR
ncbi:type II CAAX endopeptidase family protein [Rhodanobacter sp. AS-Z3]|uniref:CPBP family intramembrane glutamic endopeptidase n=1 Tax=Rhodanobacter sp. AS-Z3 TaxID=3031330 RepID=UPI0024787AEC|nr:type II CAAX endopeptidase family protein [Rhodanobacter sp. AS-Z3]WEN14907.1 type II CAAX endopeptidase family protein [Rhodanobacter sp. AS-Z3]